MVVIKRQIGYYENDSNKNIDHAYDCICKVKPPTHSMSLKYAIIESSKPTKGQQLDFVSGRKTQASAGLKKY